MNTQKNADEKSVASKKINSGHKDNASQTNTQDLSR